MPYSLLDDDDFDFDEDDEDLDLPPVVTPPAAMSLGAARAHGPVVIRTPTRAEEYRELATRFPDAAERRRRERRRGLAAGEELARLAAQPDYRRGSSAP